MSMLKDMFKKADFILLAVLVVIGIAASVALAHGRSAAGQGGEVVLNKDGHEIARYTIDEDRSILVDAAGEATEYPAGNDILSDGSSDNQDAVSEELPRDYNIIRIRSGKVSVIKADCRSQVCVDHKAISRSGESIICLPHKLVVEIVSADSENDYDTLAK